MVRSAEANAYRRQVAALAEQLGVEALDGGVSVELELLPKATISGAASAVILDLDNCIKVALDAVQGVAYANDRQVREIVARYGGPVEAGGLILRISPY